jgi:hypothetical protein
MMRHRLLLALGILFACTSALAQWQWIDKDGRKVFSDRAPPADIPAKNILRQPGPTARLAPAAGAPGAATAALNAPTTAAADSPGRAASAAGADEAPAPKLSQVEKDLAERKKQAEAAAAAKTKADKDAQERQQAETCARARANRQLIESGVRVSVANPKGEKVVLDDAGRAAEMSRVQTIIDQTCR